MKKKPSGAQIARKAATGLLLPHGGVINQSVADLQARRQYAAEHALGAITERVGADAFDAIVKRDPEIEALLWMTLRKCPRGEAVQRVRTSGPWVGRCR